MAKKSRYSVQELVKQIGERAGEMRSKTITIVGLGGVGSVLAEMTARAGIGLRIIDKGRVLEEELQRQSLFLNEDVTKFKAKQAKKRLEAINPEAKVKAFHEELNQNTTYLLESDLVVDCSNDLKVSMLVDKYCSKKGIPMIYCYAAGTQGQVFVVYKKASLNEISDYVKNQRIREEGITAAAVHMGASIIASTAAKLLLDMPYEKNMVAYDAWDLTIDTKYVRKNKKK